MPVGRISVRLGGRVPVPIEPTGSYFSKAAALAVICVRKGVISVGHLTTRVSSVCVIPSTSSTLSFSTIGRRSERRVSPSCSPRGLLPPRWPRRGSRCRGRRPARSFRSLPDSSFPTCRPRRHRPSFSPSRRSPRLPRSPSRWPRHRARRLDAQRVP